jgi:hypothetical protein
MFKEASTDLVLPNLSHLSVQTDHQVSGRGMLLGTPHAPLAQPGALRGLPARQWDSRGGCESGKFGTISSILRFKSPESDVLLWQRGWIFPTGW